MPSHRRRRSRLDPTSVVVLVATAALAVFIVVSVLWADIPATDCYSNPDVRGQWC